MMRTITAVATFEFAVPLSASQEDIERSILRQIITDLNQYYQSFDEIAQMTSIAASIQVKIGE
jgi:hypothetical protein